MTALLLFLFALQTPNGTIEGIVRDAATNAPIYGANVTLGPASDDPKPLPAPAFSAMTDDAGHFRISAPPGDYTIRAQRDGYYGASRNGVSAETVSRRLTLAPLQQVTNLNISLQQGGAITGQLFDAAGRPKVGLVVSAMRLSYDNGRRFFSAVRKATTNDRGEFRLYWVPPGEYIIAGELPSSPVANNALPTLGRLAARTFFPGTTDLTKATAVTVKSGSETTGFNFVLQTVKTVNVVGRIVNPYAARPADAPPPTSSFIAPPRITLVLRNAAINESFQSFGNNATAAESREGVFRFIGVQPGQYDLYVIASDGGSAFKMVAGAKVSVDIGNQDVAGLTVTVRPPVELRGRVMVNGDGPRIDLPRLGLRAREPGATVAAYTPPSVSIPQTGEFKFANVLPSAYALDFPIPSGLFLADVRQGDQSIIREAGVTIGSELPEALQIILGRNGGTVRGSITDAAIDTTVVLVPDSPLRANAMLYYTTRPNDAGNFELKDIAPGNYKLFTWESVLTTAWMNAEFLKQYEDRGLPIKIGQTVTNIETPITPIK